PTPLPAKAPSRRDRVAGPERPAAASGSPAAGSASDPGGQSRPATTTSAPVPPRPLEPWTPPAALEPAAQARGAPGRPAAPEQRPAPPGPRRPDATEPAPGAPAAPRHPGELKRFTISRRPPTRPTGRTGPSTGPIDFPDSGAIERPVDP